MTYIFGTTFCLLVLAVALSLRPGRKDSLRASLGGFMPLAACLLPFMLLHAWLPEGHGMLPILDYSLSCLYLLTILSLRGHGFKAWYFLPMISGLGALVWMILLPPPTPLLPSMSRLIPLAGIFTAMVINPVETNPFPKPWFLTASITLSTLLSAFSLPWPELTGQEKLLLVVSGIAFEFCFRLFTGYQVLFQERKNQDQSLTLYRDWLLNISQVLHNPENARILYQDMVNGLGAIIPSQGSALLLLNGTREGQFSLKSVRGSVRFPPELFEPQDSRHDDDQASTEQEYRLAPDAARKMLENGKPWYPPEKPGTPRHILIPLIQDERFYGLFLHQSDSRKGGQKIPESTFNSFIHSSSLAVASMEAFARSSHQVSTGAEIQLSRFIQDLCFKGNQRVFSSAHGQSAIFHQRDEGGHSDYLDCMVRKNGQFCGIISDTAGAGLESALITFIIRTLFQLFAPADRSPAEILSWMNRAATRKIKLERYANVLVWCWNPDTRQLSYASAGTVHAFIVPSAQGPGRILSGDQVLLGMENDALYENWETLLDTGDILACHTDGFIESLNPAGTSYGLPNLMNIISTNRSLDAQSIASAAASDLSRFCTSDTSQPQDEKSLLIFKIQS